MLFGTSRCNAGCKMSSEVPHADPWAMWGAQQELNRTEVWRLRLVRGWSHDQTGKVSAGTAERAVRMVFEHQDEHPSQWSAICSIAAKFTDCLGLSVTG